MEFYKEMGEHNMTNVLEILNIWWNEENIPTGMLNTKVVLIYKKGDTNKFQNYRPISLLNSMYKLFTAVLQKRISQTLDSKLQETQYGFRANRGTADAIYLVRRMMEYGENNKHPTPIITRLGKSIR